MIVGKLGVIKKVRKPSKKILIIIAIIIIAVAAIVAGLYFFEGDEKVDLGF